MEHQKLWIRWRRINAMRLPQRAGRPAASAFSKTFSASSAPPNRHAVRHATTAPDHRGSPPHDGELPRHGAQRPHHAHAMKETSLAVSSTRGDQQSPPPPATVGFDRPRPRAVAGGGERGGEGGGGGRIRVPPAATRGREERGLAIPCSYKS
jgi:hypothetical protein